MSANKANESDDKSHYIRYCNVIAYFVLKKTSLIFYQIVSLGRVDGNQ